MQTTAQIVEIFSSRQGEGLYVGKPMTFLRFGRCGLRCQYCDTPQGLCHQESFRVESPAGSESFVDEHNPVSAARLSELVATFDDPVLAITGGEPLEQADFLVHWLPSQTPRRTIMLETNGIHVEELKRVLPFLHIVSMDIKLPSATGRRARWEEHKAFLETALSRTAEVYAKIIVTAETTDRDIERALDLIGRTNKHIPLIIQPASATLTFHHPATTERIESLARLCGVYLPNVQVIPQMHKQWGVL